MKPITRAIPKRGDHVTVRYLQPMMDKPPMLRQFEARITSAAPYIHHGRPGAFVFYTSLEGQGGIGFRFMPLEGDPQPTEAIFVIHKEERR